MFQRLEGEATREGLWLTSTVANQPNDRFCVKAVAVGRGDVAAGVRACRRAVASSPADWATNSLNPEERLTAVRMAGRTPSTAGVTPAAPSVNEAARSPKLGIVEAGDHRVRFVRPGLVEEYSVGLDGVRQDFVVFENPGGSGRKSAPFFGSEEQMEPTHVGCYNRKGELRVELSVSGARVEAAPFGARLVLEKSGRKIAYSRLHVTDATGRELPARMEVVSGILPDVEGGHPAARNPASDLREGVDFSDGSDCPSVVAAGLEAAALGQARMPAATFTVVVNDQLDSDSDEQFAFGWLATFAVSRGRRQAILSRTLRALAEQCRTAIGACRICQNDVASTSKALADSCSIG